jgi:glycosyltransferase involved in cell wall biosynthesis
LPRSVSIVIPARDAADSIERAVAAALAQQGLDGVPEVIVADDGSTDGTGEAAAHAGARVIRLDGRGPAAARNAGAAESRGEALLFTDADCAPAPDWAERLAHAVAYEKVGAAGGGYLPARGAGLLAGLVDEEIAVRHSRMGVGAVRALGSYSLAVRRDVFDRVGGFDESYRRASGEDTDLSYRLLEAGLELRFVPEALVEHRHPNRFWRYLRTQLRHGFWRVKLYRDHPAMVRGDDYSGPLDFAGPVLALGALALTPFLWIAIVAAVWCVLILGVFATQAPLAVRVGRRPGAGRGLAFLGLAATRAAARGLGMGIGVLRFGLPFGPGQRREKG